MMNKKILVGGAKLRELGNDRYTDDMDYLVYEENNSKLFIHDPENSVDYINCANHNFFKEVWEAIDVDVTPELLLELKAFALVQHFQNFDMKKVASSEYDIKFLVREYHVSSLKICEKFLSYGEINEVKKIIGTAK